MVAFARAGAIPQELHDVLHAVRGLERPAVQALQHQAQAIPQETTRAARDSKPRTRVVLDHARAANSKVQLTPMQ